MTLQRGIIPAILVCLLITGAAALETPVTVPALTPADDPILTLTINYEGTTPVTRALDFELGETALDKIFTAATDAAYKSRTFPYTITRVTDAGLTEIVTIGDYRCTDTYCYYWIEATRDGLPVNVSNPVVPYLARDYFTITETRTAGTVTTTVSLHDDPISFVEEALLEEITWSPVEAWP